MIKNIQYLLVIVFVSLSLPLQATASVGDISVFADKQGHWGATDANGVVIVPFQYDYAKGLEDGNIIVGQAPKKYQKYIYGVFNAQGKEIIPRRFMHIDYDHDFKRFKVMVDSGKTKFKYGYLDENGKEVIPPIYDSLERISNMGDEPTNVAKRNGKYGYINLLSGKIMIPVGVMKNSGC